MALLSNPLTPKGCFIVLRLIKLASADCPWQLGRLGQVVCAPSSSRFADVRLD